MKKTLLGLALASLAFACKSTDAELSTSAEAESMECCAEAAECGDASDCSTKSDCDASASSCSEGGEAKVCPVTGKTMN